MSVTRYALFVCALGLLGCGSSHAGDDSGLGDSGVRIPLPPFPLERREVDLSDEEFREFCVWWVAQWWVEPEEQTYECLDGAIEGRYMDVDACMGSRPDPATTPDCTFTIGDWYECISAEPDRCTPAPLECERPAGCGLPVVWI